MQGIVRVPVLFVNAYLVETPAGFTVVDTGIKAAGAALIRAAASGRFGATVRPTAIVLTHGHFDHAGSAAALAEAWDVPVYASLLEQPFLSGRCDYPPQDPSVGGALANLSRVFPRGALDLGSRLRLLSEEHMHGILPGWQVVRTPGHTPGHISLFRSDDGVLLAGDALATMDQDSAWEMVAQHRRLCQPPATFTPDWDAAERSIHKLASLRPSAIAAGHGLPMEGPHVAEELTVFARTFRRPAHGRYVVEPARADEQGIISVPPPVQDPVGRALRIGGAAAAVVALAAVVRRAGRSEDSSRRYRG